MAACTIFQEDEVSILTEHGQKCGLVIESSEYVSSSEDTDDDDDDILGERVKKGTIRVVWHPDGNEEVINESKVKLVDRSLMPGDVVRRFIEGQDSQRGYVCNTRVNCYVQLLGRNTVICDLDSRDLENLRAWELDPGDVYLDSWVGKIERLVEIITFKFSDGARCQMDDDLFYPQLCLFHDLNEKREPDCEFVSGDYYIGQQLKGPLYALKSANWLKTTSVHNPTACKKKNRAKDCIIVVDAVEAKTIEVHWLCRGYSSLENNHTNISPPPKQLKPEHIARLKRLDCFDPCSVQIGDKMFYTIKDLSQVKELPGKSNQPLISHVLNKTGHTNSASIESCNKTNCDVSNCDRPATADLCDASCESDGDSKVEPSADAVAVASIAEKDHGISDAEAASNVELEAEGETDEDEAEGSDTASSQASVRSKSGRKKKGKRKGISMHLKSLRKKKFKGLKKILEDLKEGDRLPVEVIYTFSAIDVMWQDGSVEQGISSTDLFPIHHLDELEFFPGDFVVAVTDTQETDSYGRVELVDHTERTCMVRWMKPYKVGKNSRPDESISAEEVSVYDIKDHPDYKFRPGHVVVRVGGYEDYDEKEVTEAAGQVYDMGSNGQLLIHWADGKRTHCYPQELYLLGDELSELNDSEFDSESEGSGSDTENSQDCSWETEDEEEARSDDDDDVTIRISVQADQKVELDQQLEVVKSTMQKLEENFATRTELDNVAIYCYKEILQLYRCCRSLDKMMAGSYFEEDTLVQTITTIRKQLKLEKTVWITKHVMELFESNCQKASSSTSGADSGVGKSPSEGSADDPDIHCEHSAGSSSKAADDVNCIGPDGDSAANGTDAADTESKANSSGGSDDAIMHEVAELTKELQHLEKELSRHKQGSDNGAAAAAVKCDGEDKTEAAAVNENPDADPMEPDAKDAEDKVKPRELCQNACRMLRLQVTKVHNDLEKKWQKLKECGKLKVLGEESSDEDFSDDEEKLKKIIKKIDARCAKVASESGMGCPPGVGEGAESSSGDLVEDDKELKDKAGIKVEDDILCTIDGNSKSESDKNTKNESGQLVKEKEAMVLPLVTTPMKGSGDDEKWAEEQLDKGAATPQTPAEVREKLEFNKDGFAILEEAPEPHMFYKSEHQPSDIKVFFASVRKELKLLHSSLPFGIHVKGYEDRMDLYTIMIKGPTKTPYEDGLFFFDVQLPHDYPTAPPRVHYISFCSDRLNPNLYEDGKVCVSLLGTWTGRGTEVWTSKSSLLQVLISIQGLILVSEPYYNEAGYEKQKGSQQGLENSRMYNEMAILKLVQSMAKIVINPPVVFETEVIEHLKTNAFTMIDRLKSWLDAPTTKLSSPAASCPQGVDSATAPAPACVKSLGPEEYGSPSQKSNTPPAANNDLPVTAADGIPTITVCDDVNTSQCSSSCTSPAGDPPGSSAVDSSTLPDFPLLPISRGFRITLKKHLQMLKSILLSVGISQDDIPS